MEPCDDTIKRCKQIINLSKYAFIISLLGIIVLPNKQATAAMTAVYVSNELGNYPDVDNIHSKVSKLLNIQLDNALSESK